jgi:hypothetical protein
MSIQYMTTEGDWAASCQEGTPPPSKDLIPAPADGDGIHGADGMRWTGTAWVDDPSSSDRALAILYPEVYKDKLKEDGAVSRLQFELAAGEELWSNAENFANSPYCPWALKRVISSATVVDPKSENLASLAYILNVDETQMAEIFRKAKLIKP